MLFFRPRFSYRAPLLFSAAALLAAFGCGGDDGIVFDDPDAGVDGAGQGDGGGTADGGDDGAGGSGGEGGGGPGGCTSATDCNDGIACTVDVCVNGVCSHYPGPSSGATACPDRQHCQVGKGCVDSPACASDAQCEAIFGVDACKTNIRCDPGPAVCTFSILDNDNDGHVPLVCGGDDCNDADDGIHGGHPEVCDGRDNDCNGIIDDNAICPGAGVCQGGQCVCPPANQCGSACVDKTSDANHCGTCNRACPGGLACEGGQCVCPATSVTCGGVCVDTQASFQHCGGCNKPCLAGQKCESGKCVKAPCTPPALFVMQDMSGSMAWTMSSSNSSPGVPSRWDQVKSGLQAFIQQPASAGISMGIGYFPAAFPASACGVAGYETPAVSIATLPGNAGALEASFERTPTGGSVVTAPLEGSLQYVRGWAAANPLSQAAVVLVFDSEGNNSCAGDTLGNAAMIAANAASASPPVKTFAIGVGHEADQLKWSQVSQAGGTGSAFMVMSSADMTAALQQIRDTMLACP